MAEQLEAQVLYENFGADEQHGTYEYGRVGFRIGNRVFWLDSYYFPGTSSKAYQDAVAEAADICGAVNVFRRSQHSLTERQKDRT
jgi:hypothetical protein